QTRLPVIIAVQHNKNAPSPDAAKCSGSNLRLTGELWQLEPEHVHRRGSLDWFKAGETTHDGKAPIGTNRQFRAKFVFCAVGTEVAHADNGAIFFDQVLYLGVHH